MSRPYTVRAATPSATVQTSPRSQRSVRSSGEHALETVTSPLRRRRAEHEATVVLDLVKSRSITMLLARSVGTGAIRRLLGGTIVSRRGIFGPPVADWPRISRKRSGCRTGRILGSLPVARRATCPLSQHLSLRRRRPPRPIRAQATRTGTSPQPPSNRLQTSRPTPMGCLRLPSSSPPSELNAAAYGPWPTKRPRPLARRGEPGVRERPSQRQP